MSESLSLRGAKLNPSPRRLDDTQFSEDEKAYFQECQNEFLTDDIISSGLISISEFEDRSQSLCDKFSPSGACSLEGSSSVTDEIRSVFFGAVCVSMPDSKKCVSDLNSLGSVELGYIISPRRMVQAQMQVDSMCVQMHSLIFGREIASQNASSSFGGIPFTDSDSNLLDSEPGSNEGTLDLPSSSLSNSVLIAPPESAFSSAPIVGITVAACACLLLLVYVSIRRYRRSALSNISGKESSKKNSLKTKLSSFFPTVKHGRASIPAEVNSVNHSEGSTNQQKHHFRGLKDNAKEVLLERIEEAVDNASWDEVYKIASQLAEHDDLSALSNSQKEKRIYAPKEEKLKKRSNLTEEDFRRTRTLDDLISTHDWTGVAVTAALFAGESGYKSGPSPTKGNFLGLVTGKRVSEAVVDLPIQDAQEIPALSTFSDDSKLDCTNADRGDPILSGKPQDGIMTISSSTKGDSSLIHLKESIDLAVEASDWDQVRSLSNAVEQHDAFRVTNIETFKTEAMTMRLPSKNLQLKDSAESGAGNTLTLLNDEMNRAINNADWSLVSFYAERMREARTSNHEQNCNGDSLAIVPVIRPQTIQTVRTEDSSNSNLSRKATITKLAQAGKWKGVSIMAGLYDMESKGSLPVDVNTMDAMP